MLGNELDVRDMRLTCRWNSWLKTGARPLVPRERPMVPQYAKLALLLFLGPMLCLPRGQILPLFQHGVTPGNLRGCPLRRHVPEM